ncbi:MAG: alkaline phosphatase [Thermoanaerobaculales bacterium]|nr:alkaline phosphatase [Thermoanaerobaculales bacterium]
MQTRRTRFLIDGTLTLLAVVLALLVFSRFRTAELAVGNLLLRSQGATSHPVAGPPAAALTGTAELPAGLTLPEERPRNVVLFIGDGMGVGHLSAASLLLVAPGTPLALCSHESFGMVATWAADDTTTDSAASATALATGFKTDVKVLGLVPDGRRPVNLFEAARAHGKATGVITSSGLVDATPACFTAHAEHRELYDQIFAQMLSSGTDLLLGGDWSAYRKARRNAAYSEMVAAAEELGSRHGFAVVRDAERMASAGLPLLGLFPPRPRGPVGHGPPLSESLERALELLAPDPEGFVLLVESEVTDEAGHDNDIAGVLAGMRELEAAVVRGLEFAAARGDTLVLVTADHDTGTLAVIDGPFADGRATIRWASGDHSAQWVPIFATGPGSGLFAGLLDNTEIAPRLAALLGLEALPRLAE